MTNGRDHTFVVSAILVPFNLEKAFETQSN